MPNNSGKYLEDAVSKYFDNLKLASTTYTRLSDSRSARNLIKAQNADFIVTTVASGAFHLECKSVAGRKRVLRKPSQFPIMLRWARAGTRGFFLIHFHELDEYAYLEVSDLDSSAKSWPVQGTFKEFDGVIKAIIARASCQKV